MQNLISSRRFRRSQLARLAFAATAGVGGLCLLNAAAHAQTYEWSNVSGGDWATGSNWTGGISPPGTQNDQILFDMDGNYTSVPDTVGSNGPVNLNSLTVSMPTPSSTVTIGLILPSYTNLDSFNFVYDSNGDAPLMNVTSGSLNIENACTWGAGSNIINSGTGNLILGAGTVAQGSQTFGNNTVITNSGNGTVQLADFYPATTAYNSATGSTNLTFSNPGGSGGGTGTFLIGNLNEGVVGTLNITGGPVAFSGNIGGNLFGLNLILNVVAPGSFNFANNGEVMGGIEGNGNIILGSAGVTLTLPGDRTYTGSINGTGGLAQDNGSNLTLGGTNTYSGTTTIEAYSTLTAAAPNALSPSSYVNVTLGTLNLNGYSQTIAGLSGNNQTASLPLGGSTLSINVSGSTVRTFFSPLTGAGNLVLTGTGTEWLPGSNTYTGTTNIMSGTLRIPWAGLNGGSGVNIATGATLQTEVDSNSTSVIGITGGGTFIKDGAASLAIAASNPSLSLAALDINSGNFTLNHTSDTGNFIGSSPALNLGSGSVTLISNAVSAVSSQAFAGTALVGGGQLAVNGNGQAASINAGAITRSGLGATIDFAYNNSGSIATPLANGSYNIVGAYATANETNWAVTNGTTAGALAAGSYSANKFNATSGTTVVHTDVTSSFTATTNAYTSDIRFNTASPLTLTLGSKNILGDGGILVTPNVGSNYSNISGGTSITAAANQDLVIQQFNPSGALNFSSVVANTAGTATTYTNASIAVSNSSSSSQTLTLPSVTGLSIGEHVSLANTSSGTVLMNYSNDATIVAINPSALTVTISTGATPVAGTASTLIFTPGTNVVKSGPGTLNLLATTNTFQGVLVLNQGKTVITGSGTNAEAAVGSLGSTSTSSTTGSSSVYFNGGTMEFANSYSTGLGVQNWIIGPGGATIQADQGYAVVKEGSTVWGGGDITLTGPGTFDIGSDGSSFSGRIFVNNGIFRLTSNQVQSCSGITVASGAQFYLLDTTSGPFNLAAGASLALNGNGPSNSGAWLHTLDEAGSARYAFNSPVLLQSTSRFTEQRRMNASAPGGYDTCTDIFPLAISGPGSLIKDGDGTMILSSPQNNYGGNNGLTIVSNGLLQLGVSNSLPYNTTLQLGESGSSNSGTFDLASYNQTIGGLTTAGSGLAQQIINSNTSTPSVLTVNYNGSAGNQVFTGNIGGGTIPAPVNAGISVVKTGLGTLSLLGTTTYTGSATVAAGTLRITGSAAMRPYAVNDGATLIVTNTDGTALPASTVTLGNTGTTNLDFEFNNGIPTAGALAVNTSSGLTANGTVDVAISSTTPLAVGEYPLITYSGSIGGSGFAAFNTTPTLPSRAIGMLVNNTSNGSIDSIDLVITGVDFLKWSGAVTNNWDINTTANFALNSNGAAATYLDEPSPDSVVFDDTATGSHIVNLTTTLNPASVTVNTASFYTFSGPGSINGSAGVTVSSGTLNLLTSNTYTGLTTINTGGTVVVGNGGTNGSLGTGNVVDNGALVFNRSDSFTFNPTITGTGTLTKMGSDTLTLGGALTVSSVNISGGTLVAGAGTVNGSITGGGALVKTGTGLLAVNGDINLGGGAVNLSSGTLQIGSGSVGGTVYNNVNVAAASTLQIGNGGNAGSVAGNVTLAYSGLLNFDRSDTYTYAGNISGSSINTGTTVNVAAGHVILTGNYNYSGATTIGANTLELSSNANNTLYGKLTGTGTLIKSGSGTVTMIGSSGFTGTVNVSSGTLILADLTPTGASGGGAGGAFSPSLIKVNPTGRFVFGEGGVSGENPNLPTTTFISVQGGTFELRVGEDYGATQLVSGALLINGFGAAQGMTCLATVGVSSPFVGFDLRSGTVTAMNTGTGVGTLTDTASGQGVVKSTAGEVSFFGPMAISSGTPINISQGVLSFQAANIPTVGTAPLLIGGGPGVATLQLADSGTASIARTVNLSSGATVDFNGASGSLTITGPVIGTGDLVQTGGGLLTLSASDTYTGNTNVTSGSLVLARSGSISASPNIFVNTSANFTLAGSTNTSAIGIVAKSLGNLVVSTGGTAIAAPSTLTANRLLIVPTTLSLAGTTGAWSSKLDLGNNDLDVPSGSLATITDQLRQGYNATGGGYWNASAGITSSSAASDTTGLKALGVIINNDGSGNPLYGSGTLLGTFDGTSPGVNDVLVKYTYVGDANLDGKIDGSDYSRIDAAYLADQTLPGSDTGWYNGDFNYDGVINGSDYTLLDNAFNSQGAILADQIAAPSAVETAEIAPAAATSAVPEPATLGLLGLGALGLLGRRRRI